MIPKIKHTNKTPRSTFCFPTTYKILSTQNQKHKAPTWYKYAASFIKASTWHSTHAKADRTSGLGCSINLDADGIV